MAQKYDGVIEAVRYNRNGKIALVRAYELRGVSYSDRVLLDRETLLERLKAGKKFTTGRRKERWASTFEFGKVITATSKDGKDFLTTRDSISNRDEIEDTPAF